VVVVVERVGDVPLTVVTGTGVVEPDATVVVGPVVLVSPCVAG
jgi:hypothetical protein